MVQILKDPALIGLLLSFGAFIFVLTLVNIKACIVLLFFAVALSPKISMGGLPLRVEDFFMVILCFSWLARLAIKKESLPTTALDGPILVYMLICLISTMYGYIAGTANLLSADSSMSAVFHFLKKAQVFIMAYIIVANVNSKKELIQYIKYILLASTVLAVSGLRQGLTEYRISGPIGESANTIGMYFVFITIIVIGLFLSRRSYFNKVFLGGAIVLFLYVILRSLSRVSYATFIAVILTLGIFKDRRLLLFFVLLVVLVFALSPEQTLERVYTLKGVFTSGKGEYFHSWEARKWSWLNIPPIVLAESPLLGFGLASAPLCYAESGYVTDFYFTGILGMLSFFWLHITIFKFPCALKKSSDPVVRDAAIYFMGGFFTLLLGAISGPTFTAIRTTNIFWIFVGLMAGAYKLMMENKLDSDDPAKPL